MGMDMCHPLALHLQRQVYGLAEMKQRPAPVFQALPPPGEDKNQGASVLMRRLAQEMKVRAHEPGPRDGEYIGTAVHKGPCLLGELCLVRPPNGKGGHIQVRV